jgi:hypothetical protein
MAHIVTPGMDLSQIFAEITALPNRDGTMTERTFGLLAAAVAALSLSSAAHATELLFSVNYDSNGPGLLETFVVNTDEVGTLSAASAAADSGTANDIDFAITDDSLGNTVLQVGNATDNHFFSTATSDIGAFDGQAGEFTFNTTTPFWDGLHPFLMANSGEIALGTFDEVNTTINVTAIPEPATWIMMLLGVGAMGATLRGRRQLALSAV